MEELVPLFEQALDTNLTNEQRAENTKSIQQICKSPEVTFHLLNLISSEGIVSRPAVKISIAAALRQNLLNVWDENFAGEASGAEIKQAFPVVFESVLNNSILVNTLSVAIVPIIQSDETGWPELLELITSLLGREDIVANATCLDSIAKIEASIAENATDEVLGVYFESFVQILRLCIQPREERTELCNSAAPVLSSIIKRLSEEPGEELVEIFTEIFKIFIELVSTTYFTSTQISNALAESFYSRNLSGFAVEAFETLLGVASAEGFETNNFAHVFMNIEGIITAYPELFTEEHVQHLFEVSFQCAVISEDPHQARFIANTVEAASKCFEGVMYNLLIDSLRQIDGETDSHSVYIAILFFTFSLEPNLMFAMEQIEEVLGLICAFLDADDKDVKLITLSLAKELCDNFMPEQNAHAVVLIGKILESLGCEDEDVVHSALNALSSAFHSGRMPPVCLAPTLEAIIHIIQTLEESDPASVLLNEATHTAAMVIFSAQEEIIPFVEELFPIISRGAEVPEEVDAIRKGDCLIALSQMIRYAYEQLAENAPALIQLLLEVGMTEDDYLRQAVVDSFGNLVVVKAPDLENHIEELTAILDFCFYVNVESPDEENPDEESLIRPSAIECLKEAIDLIKIIYKEMPSIAPQDDPMHFADGVLILGEDASSDVLTFPAMEAAAYILIRTESEEVGQRVFEVIGTLLEGESCLGAGGAFHCLRILTKNGFAPVQGLFETAIPAALNALKQALPCQEGLCDHDEDEEEDDCCECADGDFNVIEPAIKFVKEVCEKCPEAIDTTPFIQIGKKVMNSFTPKDKQTYMVLCRSLYAKEGTPQIAKKIIVQNVIEGVSHCNYNVYPEAFITAFQIYNVDTTINIEKIAEKITEIFGNDPSGERYYWATAAHAASFICLMVDKAPSEFDYETWVPAILSKMPMKGQKLPTEFVYSHLVYMALNSELCPEEFVRVFVQILSKTDEALTSSGITQETLAGMIKYVKDSGCESFEEIISSPQEMERLTARLA